MHKITINKKILITGDALLQYLLSSVPSLILIASSDQLVEVYSSTILTESEVLLLDEEVAKWEEKVSVKDTIFYERAISDISKGSVNESILLEELKSISAKFSIISNVIKKDDDDVIISNTLKIICTSELTLAEISLMDSKIAIHNSYDLRLSIRNDYENKAKDGIEYFNLAHDDLVADVMIGDLSEVNAFLIENKLVTAFEKLKGGDWKSCHAMLEATVDLGIGNTNGDAYINAYYSKHKAYILNYINENYA